MFALFLHVYLVIRRLDRDCSDDSHSLDSHHDRTHTHAHTFVAFPYRPLLDPHACPAATIVQAHRSHLANILGPPFIRLDPRFLFIRLSRVRVERDFFVQWERWR